MSTRTFREYPHDRIETRLGALTLAVTEATHIHADANSNSATNDSIGLVLRGVRYGVSLHLYRWPDGRWHVGIAGEQAERHVYASKLDVPYPRNAASPTALRTFIEVVEAAVNEWAEHNPRIFVAAELGHLNNDIMRADDNLADLHRKLAALTEQRNLLVTREHHFVTDGETALVGLYYEPEKRG